MGASFSFYKLSHILFSIIILNTQNNSITKFRAHVVYTDIRIVLFQIRSHLKKLVDLLVLFSTDMFIN